jgi:hypothetical protein
MDSEFKNINPDHLWIYDKLILSSKLGYVCGPVGTEVPSPGYYIVRPVINFLGLGLGASIEWIDNSTDQLTPGHFWCEIFEGDHISVDFYKGKSVLVVQGFKQPDTLQKWDRWVKIDLNVQLPDILKDHADTYKWINCEFIGGKLIEAHLRYNPDFRFHNNEFIPVWEEQSTDPPEGYSYIDYPDIHGRIGGFIK